MVISSIPIMGAITPIDRLALLSAIHEPAGADCLVFFGRKWEDKLLPLVPCRVRDAPYIADGLQANGVFPQYMKWNLYNPISVFLKDDRGDIDAAIDNHLLSILENQNAKPRYLLTHAYRLAELAAINIDLDVGMRKDGSRYVDAETALSIVSNMVSTGDLPAPSVIGFSGQGLYLLYALISEDGSGRLPDATFENQIIFKNAADGLIKRCSSIADHLIPDNLPRTLHPDATSKSTIQWFKTPDCPHPGTGQPIQYFLYGTCGTGTLRRYQLAELLQWNPESNAIAKLHPNEAIDWRDYWEGSDGRYRDENGFKHTIRLDFSPSKDTADQHRRRRIHRKTNATWPMRRRAEDLERLAEYRKTIPKGMRGLWLCIYFNTLRGIFRGDHKGDIDKAYCKTCEFNQKYCKPLLPDREIKSMAYPRKAGQVYNYKTETLLEMLGITPEEIAKAGLLYLVPKSMRPRKYKAKLTREERRKRDESIFQDFKERMPIKAIADKYRLKTRQIYNLKRQHENHHKETIDSIVVSDDEMVKESMKDRDGVSRESITYSICAS